MVGFKKNFGKRDVDRMVDLGLSLLAGYGDNVSRVMDYLDSTYGSLLSQDGWIEVENEIQDYVDGFIAGLKGGFKKSSEVGYFSVYELQEDIGIILPSGEVVRIVKDWNILKNQFEIIGMEHFKDLNTGEMYYLSDDAWRVLIRGMSGMEGSFHRSFDTLKEADDEYDGVVLGLGGYTYKNLINQDTYVLLREEILAWDLVKEDWYVVNLT